MFNRRALLASICSCLVACAQAWAADSAPAKVTVLARDNTIEIAAALVEGDDLLVPPEFVPAITGFEVKPQGLCTAEVCIPIPSDSGWVVKRGDATYFNLTRFAAKMDQVFAVDRPEGVWSFTAVPRNRTSQVFSGEAPDFTLPDRTGKLVKLSDFRGKKVLILTWASWCGCRFDLAGWQEVYESLKDKNFEIVAAAQDTGGPAAANRWYDKAHVTYTALVDAKHAVSSLYQMVNVPTGVWIDESGKIVRAPEVSYSKEQQVLSQTIGDNRYPAAVRDWVENGAKSSYLMSPEKVKARLAVPSAPLRLAEAQFKLGVYFSDQGNRELAAKHWQESQKLSPDNWNYHRQDWAFDKKTEMSNWFTKVRKLGTRPYYEPAEFPQASSEK
jgi:peroxiredoxin